MYFLHFPENTEYYLNHFQKRMFNIPTCSPLNTTLNNENNNKTIPKSLAQLLADRRPSYSVSIPSESKKLSRECRKGNEQVCGKDDEANKGSSIMVS